MSNYILFKFLPFPSINLSIVLLLVHYFNRQIGDFCDYPIDNIH